MGQKLLMKEFLVFSLPCFCVGKLSGLTGGD